MGTSGPACSRPSTRSTGSSRPRTARGSPPSCATVWRRPPPRSAGRRGAAGASPRGRSAAARRARPAARYAAGGADPNVLPALIAILAHAGDAARYEEFLGRFRAAATPQEEQRYLYALAGFRQAALLEQTLARTVNGEVRTQDAPFVTRARLLSVHPPHPPCY